MNGDDNVSKKRHIEEESNDVSAKKVKSLNIDHSVMSEPISQDIRAINMENILDDNTHYTKHVSKGYKQKMICLPSYLVRKQIRIFLTA